MSEVESPQTLADEEIETRRLAMSPRASVADDVDTGDDTGDDAGDPTDTSDTGDDAGDDSGDSDA